METPPNLGASFVKPYDQGRIEQVARRVQQPSPYDQYFEEAAKQYGLDPRELKMRAAVESSLDPRAVSQDGAKGLMQFMPATAKQWGVTDPSDPRQAIFGAAKMISTYRNQAAGDMTVVDKKYYGGANGSEGNGWGPNTNQYAAGAGRAGHRLEETHHRHQLHRQPARRQVLRRADQGRALPAGVRQPAGT